MSYVGIGLGIALVVAPTWIAAMLLGVKERGFLRCAASVIVSVGVTYIVRQFISNDFIGIFVGTPFVAIINAKIFETTIVRGGVISILAGVLLACLVLFLQA